MIRDVSARDLQRTEMAVGLGPSKGKDFATSLRTLEQARMVVRRSRGEEDDGRPRNALRPGGTAGMTMQLVVGATPDSDKTIIDRISSLYDGGGIHHSQFSAFRPIRPARGGSLPCDG